MKRTFLFCIAILSVLPSLDVCAQKPSLDSLFKFANEKTVAGDVPGATALLLAANKLAQAGNNVPMLCRIQVTMGKVSMISENNEGVEAAVQQGLRFCGACKDTNNLAKIYLLKGVLKIKQQQNDSAIVFFKLSANLYLTKKDTMGSANALAKIGNVLEVEKKYAEALPYYLKLYEAAQKKPESVKYLTSNIYLTGNYLYQNQFEKALFHNRLVKQLSQKLDAKYEYALALRYDALILKKTGQFERAFNELYHYLEFYQDTLMSKIQLEQAEEMKAKYEAEKKEAQIALQDAQLGRERLKFWAVAAGLVAALIGGFLLFKLTRQLRKRNEEKEFLIKEIHHRVKNNLQILSSLLHLQSRQITDETALNAVREGQNRVDAMGLIHQKLYMGDNVAKVEMKDYLQQFGQNMLDSFGLEDDRVQIQYELEPLYLDVDTAIPLGLIINELVTNSLKYAFPPERRSLPASQVSAGEGEGASGRPGVVTIGLWKDDQGRLCLKISDNGVGQAGAEAIKGSTSFGTNLVQMLSKKLKGKPEVLNQEEGYATFIAFENFS